MATNFEYKDSQERKINRMAPYERILEVALADNEGNLRDWVASDYNISVSRVYNSGAGTLVVDTETDIRVSINQAANSNLDVSVINISSDSTATEIVVMGYQLI